MRQKEEKGGNRKKEKEREGENDKIIIAIK